MVECFTFYLWPGRTRIVTMDMTFLSLVLCHELEGRIYESRDVYDPRDWSLSFVSLLPCAFISKFAYDADFHLAPPTTSTTTNSLPSFQFAPDSRIAADTDTPAGYYTTLSSFPVSRLVLRPGVKHIFDTPFRPFFRVFPRLHDIALTLAFFIKRIIHVRDVHGPRRPVLSNHPSPFSGP